MNPGDFVPRKSIALAVDASREIATYRKVAEFGGGTGAETRGREQDSERKSEKRFVVGREEVALGTTKSRRRAFFSLVSSNLTPRSPCRRQTPDSIEEIPEGTGPEPETVRVDNVDRGCLGKHESRRQ